MPKLIGTAGHVDHGKTTLIKALTGIDADRLPEEKERGMTIDIGFAYIDLPRHGRVSIVDVPGHERFLTNMLVGALGVDVAMLCVSASESVMPQTREHLQILDLLPVDRLVTAMTQADLADEETRFIARTEIEELLGETRFAGSPILEVSALTGEGLDELREALSDALDRAEQTKDGPWYLPIDRAFSVKGHGCVVTGTLAQGQVKVGDRAWLEPGHLEVRVRSIHSHGDALSLGEGGRRIALNLSGIKVEDVRRGQTLGEPGALFETRQFDAQVRWVGEAKHGMRVRVSIGAEEAIGKLFMNDADSSLAQIRLESAVACAKGQPLVIRRYSPPDLLAGGRVAVPLAHVRRRGEKPVQVQATDDASAILDILSASPEGIATEEICRHLGKTPQALGDVFERLTTEDRVRGFAGLWFDRDSHEAAVERLLVALGEVHRHQPQVAWHPREKVAQRAGLGWAGKPFDRLVARLVSEGRLQANGPTIRLPSFQIELTSRQRAFLDRVVEVISATPVNTPNAFDISRAVTAPIQAVEEILKLGVQAGELVALPDGIFYTPDQLQALKKRVVEIAGGKPFTAAQVRDAIGTTRRYVIPLLEYFDAQRFTTRVGDQRMINDERAPR